MTKGTRPPAEKTNIPQEVISIQHLWAGYDREPVLEDINLSVKELDFIGLIGPNGSGKTTLFKVLLGLVQPLRGEVRIMGKKCPKKVGNILVTYLRKSNLIEISPSTSGMWSNWDG